MFLFYCVIISGLYVTESLAARRVWLSDISYDNPHNWNVGHVPCEADRVVFPEDIEFPVQLSPDAIIKELVLPNHGDILLSSSGKVTITDTYLKSSSCRGEDAVFKKFQAMHWLDSKNWNGWNKATPHIERVPCQTDRVVFPEGGTFRVVMPWQTVQVAALTLRGEEMDTLTWEQFSRSEVGLQMFYKDNFGPGDLEISSVSAICKTSGCDCSNDYLKSAICERVLPCGATKCYSPVLPKGFCCQICGAFLSFHFTREFRLSYLKNTINDIVKEHNWAVSWYVSKYENTIQLVIVENGEYSGDVDDISDKLNEILIKGNLGLVAVSVHSSGPLFYHMSVAEYLERFLFTMLAAFVLVAGIFVYYYSNSVVAVRRTLSNNRRPFLFARFENQSEELRLRNQQSVSIVSLPQAFDNPMYGTTSQTTTVENPVYSELIKEEEKAEEKAEEIPEKETINETPKEKEELLEE